jgi:hypothetical protein
VRKGGIRVFPGNVSYYLEATAAERVATLAEPSTTPPGKLAAATGSPGASTNSVQPDGKQDRKKTGDLNKRLAPQRKKAAEWEKRIGEIEAKIGERELAMTDPAFFQRAAATKADMEAYEAAKSELEAAYAAWGAITEEISAAEAAG